MLNRFGLPASLPAPDLLSQQAVADRAVRVLRPSGSMARMDESAAWIAAWQRTDCPTITRPVLLIAAADHGVARRTSGVESAQLTKALVDAIRAGVASSSVAAQVAGVTMRLIDAGVGAPSGDIAVEPALSTDEFDELVELGVDTVAELDTDLLILSDLGTQSATAAAALAAAICGGPAADWIAPREGEQDGAFEQRAQVVEAARSRVGEVEPYELARQLGGGDLAVLMGACIGARRRSIPVLLDGFATAAAVAPLALADGRSLEHCLAGHLSTHPAHARLLDAIGVRALFDLGVGAAEGVGSLAVVPVLRMALATVVDVATVEEWGVR